MQHLQQMHLAARSIVEPGRLVEASSVNLHRLHSDCLARILVLGILAEMSYLHCPHVFPVHPPLRTGPASLAPCC